MSDLSKLYRLTSEDCSLPSYVSPNGVSHQPAHDIPQVLWPDGTVCWLVNMYLLSGFRKARSRKNKGGTLLTWAKHLSHLVRWCALNTTDFVDLTDSHFRMFVNYLLEEKDAQLVSEKRRSEPQVATICSTVLNFLAFVDERFPGLNLLGPSGRIRAERKTFQFKSRIGSKPITREAWVHECVPRSRNSRRRQPISSVAVNKLYEANAAINATPFVVRRRFVMLRLLEVTGGRRIEISFVKISDLEEAQRTGELRLFDAKQRRDDAVRFVPVSRADLQELLSFVKHYRRRVVRALGPGKDHGFLFVAEKTGLPLEIDTLGTELYVLRKAAGIEDEEACMHAFRHRFITNIFRDLIRTHRYQNANDLQRALLSTETLMAKVMQWTGHQNIESLKRYIHLAFEAEASFHETLDLVNAKRVIQSLHLMLKDYRVRLRAPRPTRETVSSLADMVAAAASELDDLMRNTSDMSQSALEH